jgi:hypothetical protein
MSLKNPRKLLLILAALAVNTLNAAPGADVQGAMQTIDAEIKPDHYEVARADLNGDGIEDALVLMNGQSGYCGSGGCTLFVMKGRVDGFDLVGAVKVVNRPVWLRRSRHQGYRDLLVSVRGGGAVPGLAGLAFDGSSYPVAPGEANAEKREDDELLFADEAPGFEATRQLLGITFKVVSSGNQLTIAPAGLEIDNGPITEVLKGVVRSVEVADINSDGSPEIYVFIAEPAGEMRAGLIAYSANKKKSLSDIYLPPLEEDPESCRGYRGRDEMAVVEGIVARRFPIFPDDAAKAEATGKTRQLQYKLQAGEAGWVLKVDRVIEY